MRKFDPYLLGKAKWNKIRNRNQWMGERNYSSGNALPIPAGITGTCVHQQVISSSKRLQSSISGEAALLSLLLVGCWLLLGSAAIKKTRPCPRW
jgi:hypothetical protein